MFDVKDISRDLPKNGSYKKRPLENVSFYAIHHSGTETGTPFSFAKYHIENNGWAGIGYHYVIDKAGTIFKCNEIDTRCYNVGGHNSKVIGICLVGDFNKHEPSEEQLASLSWLTSCLNVLGKKPLKGHRFFKQTTCPGKNFPEAWLD